jgi:hypothetical protein
MTPEGKITKQINDYLKSLKKQGHAVWWVKLHGGPMQKAGVPDLLVLIYGRHFFFEIKKPGATATRLQQIQIDRINVAGGKALVVHSADEVHVAVQRAMRADLRGRGTRT